MLKCYLVRKISIWLLAMFSALGKHENASYSTVAMIFLSTGTF